MSQQNIYLPVNWTDGMKINKTHFIAERNAMQQQIAFSAGSYITDINYGLLPPIAREQADFDISVSLDNQQYVQVRLINCRAITPGGVFIDINNGLYGENDLSVKIPDLFVPFTELKNKSATHYVVLTADIYHRLPVGDADPAEIPPRLPYSAPTFTLSLLSQEELNGKRPGLYQLTLSRFFINEHKILYRFRQSP
jgi:hypothetical protein